MAMSGLLESRLTYSVFLYSLQKSQLYRYFEYNEQIQGITSSV